jgi:large conductance mechanosensitive channel
MTILNEFKEFALRGNVVDMAIGIIIGGAFGTIVQSLVKDVIMPPIGLLLGGVDFSDIRIPLRAASAGKEAVTMNIGTFLNNVISFLIVAAAVFMLVKAINELRKRVETQAPRRLRTATERGVSERDSRCAGEEVASHFKDRDPRTSPGAFGIAVVRPATRGERDYEQLPPPSTQNLEQWGWHNLTAPAWNMPPLVLLDSANVDPMSNCGS